jgi:hypothetical protein
MGPRFHKRWPATIYDVPAKSKTSNAPGQWQHWQYPLNRLLISIGPISAPQRTIEAQLLFVLDTSTCI